MRIRNLKFTIFALVLTIAATGVNAISETFYVDTNIGSDLNPGTNDLPWKTITKSADTAQAGDTVLVRPGVYYEKFTPVNSGTEGNLITFKADSGCECQGGFGQTKVPGSCRVILDGQGTISRAINLIDRKFIRIEGFEIRNYTNEGIRFSAGTSMPPVVSGCEIVNNYIHEIGEVGTDYADFSDESVAISADYSQGALIENNEIYRISGYPVFFEECIDIVVRGNTMHYLGQDGICVNNKRGRGLYPSNIIIEYNRLYDSCYSSAHQDAMQLWGYYNGAIIRYNTISDFTQLIYFATPADDGAEYGPMTIDNVQIYGNVFFNDKYKRIYNGDTQAIFLAGDVNYAHVNNVTIQSNTFGWLGYDPVCIDEVNISNIRIVNNIFYKGKSWVETSSNISDPCVLQSNYNLYKDSLIPVYEGPNSIKNTNPKLVNYTGEGSISLDFHLKPSSPAIDRGAPPAEFIEENSNPVKWHPRDIPDIGAYEYTADTAIEDFSDYIAFNSLETTGKGDFNHDGITNFMDYAILIEWWKSPTGIYEFTPGTVMEDFIYNIAFNWLSTVEITEKSDLNKDGIVNFDDFAILAQRWINADI